MSQEDQILSRNEKYGFTINQKVLPNLKCTLLFTEGLKNHIQETDEGWEDFKSIELLICLPDYWDLRIKPWPLEWLNKIAEVPQKKSTWFRPGDTLSTGTPPIQIDDKMNKAHSFLLMKPELCSTEVETLEKDYKFLAITPIFDDELRFKMKTSGTVLINKLRKKEQSEKVDIFRQSVQKRRFGIF